MVGFGGAEYSLLPGPENPDQAFPNLGYLSMKRLIPINKKIGRVSMKSLKVIIQVRILQERINTL